MKIRRVSVVLITVLCLISVSYATAVDVSEKKKILVVSSYHREYRWSQGTNEGFCDAMLKYGYLDNKAQVAEYTKNDYVETSKAIVKKLWMDTKRKSSEPEKEEAGIAIYKAAGDFDPDLIFLGDDNAAEYAGKKLLDSKVPVVFWGVNNTPVKYGLVDSEDRPGHNITGIYQSGYYVESLDLLKKIAPNVKTFAILSDDTSAGRSHVKKIDYFARKGLLPAKLVEAVFVTDFGLWKTRALELQKKVDAFFLVQYSGLKNKAGEYVTPEEVAQWHIKNIRIPEAVQQRQFIEQGMLCGADDSAYSQGYEAVVMAHDILANGASPAAYRPRTPKRGPLTVNRQRAEMLGIKLTEDMGIEQYIEKIYFLGDSTDEKGGKQ